MPLVCFYEFWTDAEAAVVPAFLVGTPTPVDADAAAANLLGGADCAWAR